MLLILDPDAMRSQFFFKGLYCYLFVRRGDFLRFGSGVEVRRRLVEHQNLDVPQIDESLIHQIEQTTWTGNNRIDATAQGVDLWALAYSTKNNRLG